LKELVDKHRGQEMICKNSKFKARNSKQARIFKIQMIETGGLKFGKFEFWDCFACLPVGRNFDILISGLL
jgi:hypothetical protein